MYNYQSGFFWGGEGNILQTLKIRHQESHVINMFSVNPVISLTVAHEMHLFKFLTLIYSLMNICLQVHTGHSTHMEGRGPLWTSVLPYGLKELNSSHRT